MHASRHPVTHSPPDPQFPAESTSGAFSHNRPGTRYPPTRKSHSKNFNCLTSMPPPPGSPPCHPQRQPPVFLLQICLPRRPRESGTQVSDPYLSEASLAPLLYPQRGWGLTPPQMLRHPHPSVQLRGALGLTPLSPTPSTLSDILRPPSRASKIWQLPHNSLIPHP